MKNKIGFGILAVFALMIGSYPFFYLFIDMTGGLLATKSDTLINSWIWNTGFYTHIIGGGIALLIGWVQFSKKLRKMYLNWHRWVGRVYVVSVLLSAVAGIGVGYFATGGIIPAAGFMSLGVAWFYTTYKAFAYAKSVDIQNHQKMMIYSYALCFAAVTLRIYLPILTGIFNDFIPAYRIVAWLCWVPNLFFAHYLVTKWRLKAV
jgi:hypothetical protein